jgi:hypothetical protein
VTRQDRIDAGQEFNRVRALGEQTGDTSRQRGSELRFVAYLAQQDDREPRLFFSQNPRQLNTGYRLGMQLAADQIRWTASHRLKARVGLGGRHDARRYWRRSQQSAQRSQEQRLAVDEQCLDRPCPLLEA